MDESMRYYGSAIALVSGLYSLWSAMAAGMFSMWLMLLLGIVVISHGLVLLTSYADRLAGVSGSLMVVYALLMLGNQAWMALTGPESMGMNAPATAGVDGGMVALAVLMLVSGLLMRRSGATGTGM